MDKGFYSNENKELFPGNPPPVIKSLRSNDIEVVALHNHMIGDKPRIIFLHYFGTGNALKLANAFRAALDQSGKSHEMKH